MGHMKKIDQYVSREFQIIAVVVAILGAFYGMVLLPIQKQAQELAIIKDNHLVHIEAEIADIRKRQIDSEIRDLESCKKIERVLILLEE